MITMQKHIKGTYLLLCGKDKDRVRANIEKRYVGIRDNGIPPFTQNMYFNFKRLTDRIEMFNLVTEKILDPYNVYHPIINKDTVDDIDFNDKDFTWIKK